MSTGHENQSSNLDSIRIAAVGSVMFQTRVSVSNDPGLRWLLDIVRRADAGFCNLEAPIKDRSAYPVKQYVYTSYVTAEPWVADELRSAGFSLASLANNHMSDWSPEAIDTNQRALSGAGIAWSGAGRSLAEARAPGFLDTPRGRIGLISVDSSHEYGEFFHVQMAGKPHGGVPGRPGTNGLRWDTFYDLAAADFDQLRNIHRALGLHREGLETSHLCPRPTEDCFRFRGVTVRRAERSRLTTSCHASDLEEILRWVRGTREQADYVLVSHHNHQATGDDWERPADFVQQFARAVIDAGAHAYLGHGYTPKGIEIYKGRPIFYDLGDWSVQDAAAQSHPGDAYDRWGLDFNATPGEFASARERARSAARGWLRDPEFRANVNAYIEATTKSALVCFEFEHDHLRKVELYPCVPTRHARRHLRNLPTRAEGAVAVQVLNRFARASEPFGTKIVVQDGLGRVLIDQNPAW